MTSEKIQTTDQLRQILALYYEGKTSPQQEAELKGYFLEHNDVEDEFIADRAIFISFSSEIPADLEKRILNATCGETKRRHIRPLWYRRLMETAAVLAAFVLGFTMINYNATDLILQETQTDIAQTTNYDTLLIQTPRDTTLLAASITPQNILTATPNDPYREITDPAEAAAIICEIQTLICEQMNHASQSVGEAIQTYSSIDQKLKTILQ